MLNHSALAACGQAGRWECGAGVILRTNAGTLSQPGRGFFFPSRRRHTRFKCDWSSDVCSSDLVFLWQGGFGSDALVVLVFFAAQGFEVFYKSNLFHPGPPRSISQADGPSLSELVSSHIGGNSFPSGHMMRAGIAFGLFAFCRARP